MVANLTVTLSTVTVVNSGALNMHIALLALQHSHFDAVLHISAM
jgi:hypothetical protein